MLEKEDDNYFPVRGRFNEFSVESSLNWADLANQEDALCIQLLLHRAMNVREQGFVHPLGLGGCW